MAIRGRHGGRAHGAARWIGVVYGAVAFVSAGPPLIPVEECIRYYKTCACQQSGTEFICEGSEPRYISTADVLRERLRVVPK